MSPNRMLCAALLALFALSACEQPKVNDKPDENSTIETPGEPAPEPVVVGEDDGKTDAPEAKGGKIAQPLMWVHRSEKGDAYLFGTLHVAIDAQKELPKEVWDALESSGTFVMETDLDAAAGDIMSRAVLPSGRTLEDELGKEDYKKLGEIMGPSLETYKSFKPWFIVSMLIQQMLPDGEDPNARMDPALATRASTRGKKMGYLESPAYQIGVLEETMNAAELGEMARDWDKQKATLAKMLAIYRAGDAEALEKLTFEDKAKKPQMFQKLFYQRNQNWIPEMSTYIDAGEGVFFAVGAGHIIGEDGLLDLLGKKGYAFERVTLEVK